MPRLGQRTLDLPLYHGLNMIMGENLLGESTGHFRRFYPVIKIRLENCDPSLFYYVLLDVVPVDGCR
jgi:hypothetical protein